jgi:hypothetical protein
MKKGTAKFSLLLALFALIASILACQQSGDIISDAEATARAMPTITPTSVVAENSLEKGSVAYLTGRTYLITIVDTPGSLRMIAGQERGVEVTVLDSTLFEDEIWYLIKAPTGDGWVPEENLTTEEP